MSANVTGSDLQINPTYFEENFTTTPNIPNNDSEGNKSYGGGFQNVTMVMDLRIDETLIMSNFSSSPKLSKQKYLPIIIFGSILACVVVVAVGYFLFRHYRVRNVTNHVQLNMIDLQGDDADEDSDEDSEYVSPVAFRTRSKTRM